MIVKLQRWFILFFFVFMGVLVASTADASGLSKEAQEFLARKMNEKTITLSGKPTIAQKFNVQKFTTPINEEESEVLTFPLPEGWEKKFDFNSTVDRPDWFGYEFINVIKGESMENWTEIIALFVLKEPSLQGRDALVTARTFCNTEIKKFTGKGGYACEGVRKSPADTIVIWQEHSVKGDKQIIARFIKYKAHLYTITYQSKVPFLQDPVLKQKWLEWIDASTVKIINRSQNPI